MMVRNRTAHREFELLGKIEAGIVLTGAEAKAVKTQGAKLEGGHVRLLGNEAQLVNVHIPKYKHSHSDDYDPTRTRKLLLNKKEALQLRTKMAQNDNLTIIPVSMYVAHGLVKVEIALARGRKLWQKKTVEKHRSEKRRVQKELKEFIKK
jgi:SsrA-binding protein